MKVQVQHTKSPLTFLLVLGLWLASLSPSRFAFARTSSSDLDLTLALTSTPNLRQHTRTLIINGDRAEPDRYNYFVSLQDKYEFGHGCGGSLIAADVVLTAAHCGDLTSAVITRHDLGDLSDGTVIPFEESLPHPNYDSFTMDNDFMLLFLRDPAPQDAAFVKLNRDPNFPAAGDYVTVMGHGDTKSDDVIYEGSMELLEVELNVRSNEECGESYKVTDDVITDTMLCAEDIGEDSCQGDSGGPLVIKGNDVHGSDDV